jgi:magnesium transporter
MIRSIYFTGAEEIQLNIPIEQYKPALENPQGILWVDFFDEDPEHCEDIMLNIFGFHPLAVDDALRETHVPKVDDWDTYLYIVLQDIHFDKGEAGIESQELDVFMSRNYIVTHHDFLSPTLNEVWDASQRDLRHFRHGSDRILYRLTDELTTNFMGIIESLDEEIDLVEDQVFKKPTPQMVQRIFTLKRVTLHLRRVISPLREVLNKLARDDFAVIDDRERIYFRDVYDHLVRLHDISESLRDLVGGVLDTYLSVINNRMNEVMKTLTLITTLFMPISFVVGFFGMNFFQPVEKSLLPWTSNPAFTITLMVIILTPMAMYLWMRNRKWM